MTRPTCRTSFLLPTLTLILALGAMPRPAWAQTPAPEAAPAEVTLRKLPLAGIIDGKNWSVWLELVQTDRGNVLDFLVEVARSEPRKIDMTVDRAAIEKAGIDLSRPIDLAMQQVSLQEALDRVLGDDLGFVVTDAGRVIITAQAAIPAMARRWTGFPMLVRPTAAGDEMLKKLNRSGMVDGQQWSISMSFATTPLGTVLDFIHKLAMARPREMKFATDRAAIKKAGINLDDPIDLTIREVSVGEALKMIFAGAPNLALVILDDGTALITSQEAVRTLAQTVKPVSVADTPAAAATVTTIRRRGTVGGVSYGVNRSATGVPVRQMLAEIAAKVSARDKEPVTLKMDLPADAATQAILDRKVSLHVKDWSLAEVLATVLPPELGYTVEADGSVRVAVRAKPAEGWAVPEGVGRPASTRRFDP